MALCLARNSLRLFIYNLLKRSLKSRRFEKHKCTISSKASNQQIQRLNYTNFNLLHTKNFLGNTYEHLVNQKGGGTEKKCPEIKGHPGRHQFHKDTEDALNDQISMELHAAFSYLSMACYFGRTEIALPGCQGFFMDMHKEEHEHAMIFLNYVLMRGGHVKLNNIEMTQCDWKGIVNVMETSLQMEKNVKENLMKVFDVAEKHKDLHLADFISTDFMEEQNNSICQFGRLFTRAKMVDTPVGEYLFDKWIYDSFVTKSDSNLMYKRKLDLGEAEKVYK